MNPTSSSYPDLSLLWGCPIQPAHCPNCTAAHLIPADMETALCPACFEARLEPQPTVIRPEPPELLLDFRVTPIQIKELFNRWLKGVWFHPKELNPDLLTRRLTRTFIPLWLIDGRVLGEWQASMGYDYYVASSQEVYQDGSWHTRKQTERRIRWEPRAGTIERTYHNLSIAALEKYSKIKRQVGEFEWKTASDYSPDFLEHASVRIPDLLPDAALPLAITGFDRLAAIDCQIASNAQHVDEYKIEADYQEQNWTQLLLPVYTTAYRDENGDIHPIMIHGQNGKIFGVKLASQKQSRNLSFILMAVALGCFAFGLLLALGTAILPLLGVVSLLFFSSALFVGICSPIPVLWAWSFNRSQEEE